MSDLIERLRGAEDIEHIFDNLANEAADEIVRLTKEVEQYHMALFEAEAKLAAVELENEELRAKYERLSKMNLAQHEMYEKDNNALHDELTALKASTEPFGYWHQGETYEESEFFLASESGDVRCDDCVVLYSTPPTAEALVADFKRRAVEAVENERVDDESSGNREDVAYNAAIQHVLYAIESLPLIGE